MRLRELHPWAVGVAEARDIQLGLARAVVRESRIGSVRCIGGADISGRLRSGKARAAVVVVTYPDMAIAEVAIAEGQPQFPYVPGLLSFREIPLLARAFEKLTRVPDIVIADGQGVAHPRRFGLAAHLGLLLDSPTIGCAKSRLCGGCEEPPAERGAWVDLVDGGEVIGAVLRTSPGARPLYVSVGHKIDLGSAIAWVMNCVGRYRLPEPTRLAHLAAAGRLEAGSGL